MRILVVYYLVIRTDRNTIDEHLYSFGRYAGEQCYYLNAFFGIPTYLTRIQFDLVIYHYTFTGLKWDGGPRFQAYLDRFVLLKELSGYKVAIPQDEYVNTLAVCGFFRDFGIKTVFTCLPPSEYQKVYPRELSGLEHYITVLTGYIDERALAEVARTCRPHSQRAIDIGYRARKVPFWLGRHGLIKWRLTEVFLEEAGKNGIKADLSNDYKDVFIGKDWYRFLADCRIVLGCEGGASMHDPRGEIRQRVEDYVADHPDASFEEVEKRCFPDLDGNLSLFALSPRHFEACMTRTCQALVEGEYGVVFKPGVHYVEIKKDWSNLDQVMEAIKDMERCESMAEQAYRDIVLSGKYTYRSFVREVCDHVGQVHPTPRTHPASALCPLLLLLGMRERWPVLFAPRYFLLPIFYRSRLYTVSRDALFSYLKRYNLEKEYRDLRHGHLGFTGKFVRDLVRFLGHALSRMVRAKVQGGGA